MSILEGIKNSIPSFREYLTSDRNEIKPILKDKNKENYPDYISIYEDNSFNFIISAYNNKFNQINHNKKSYNICEKIFKKNEEYIKYNSVSDNDLFLMNLLLKKQNLKRNDENNRRIIIKEYSKKVYNYFSSISNFFPNEKKSEIVGTILKMDTEKAKKITSENIVKLPPKRYKFDKEERTGKLLEMFICIFVLMIILFLMRYFFSTTKLKKEKYESILYFDSSILNGLKTNDDIKKLGKENIDDLALRFFKFADLGYKIRSKEEENNFPEPFMNWKIINYKLIGENNCFYVVKDSKNKKLIVTFPGTTNGYQLLEEIFGSSLINFHKNYTNIYISQYFGERISEILNYIYIPEVINSLQNNYQIISTGHSLGGAIAQAFIYFSLVENKIYKNNFPMSITFNQPRVGNRIFAVFLDDNSFNIRFTKGSDIVSSIPFVNFGFIDVFKYIFNKRNIYNEYIHTINEININDGFYIPSIVKVIIIFLFFIVLIIFVIVIRSFLYKLIHEYNPNTTPFNCLSSFYIIIYPLSGILSGILFYKILVKIIKYKAYAFLIILFFIVVGFFFILITFLGVFLFLILEIFIIIWNLCIIRFINLFIDEKGAIKINEKKFKESSLLDKLVIMSSFIFLTFGSMVTMIIKNNIFSHMETAQRDKNTELILNGSKLDSLVYNMNEVSDKREIGYYIVNNYDEALKKNIFATN